jgi:hypothetical protein
MHLHHIIPRSRGGTDSYVEWKSEYDHAYDHALDFVLFDQASQFDFRHPAWPLLPEDLKEAVLVEHRKRFRRYVSGIESPVRGKVRAHNPLTGADGFFEAVPEGYTPGVPISKRRPKGLLPAVTRTDILEKREEIIDSYLAGDSTVTLGERYNTSARTINNYLIKWGVPKRSTSRTGRPDKKPRKKDGYLRKH